MMAHPDSCSPTPARVIVSSMLSLVLMKKPAEERLAINVFRVSVKAFSSVVIPDLPFEEQDELKNELSKYDNAPILIQLVAPVSKQRIPMILENARGFVYCVSQMGVTGNGANFHKEIREYLENVKAVSKIPVMMGFGIRTYEDVESLVDTIDGAIVGSHFIKLLDESAYDCKVSADYIREFKSKLND